MKKIYEVTVVVQGCVSVDLHGFYDSEETLNQAVINYVCAQYGIDDLSVVSDGVKTFWEDLLNELENDNLDRAKNLKVTNNVRAAIAEFSEFIGITVDEHILYNEKDLKAGEFLTDEFAGEAA